MKVNYCLTMNPTKSNQLVYPQKLLWKF